MTSRSSWRFPAMVVLSSTICLSASANDVAFSILLAKSKTSSGYFIQVGPGDTLVFDGSPAGGLVIHGARLIVVAAHARLDSSTSVNAFDDSDVPPPYKEPSGQGAPGKNGVGQNSGGTGLPGDTGKEPVPKVASPGASGADAKEMVFDIAEVSGTGKLEIQNIGGRGGQGQKGGKGGTGGQGSTGADASYGISCYHDGGNAGPAGQGGPGGTGGTGGTGGKGGIVYLSKAMVNSQVRSLVQVSVDGGPPGKVGDPGEHGEGGASQTGGNGGGPCHGGQGTGAGGIGPEGSPGDPGLSGAVGSVIPLID
jgi:hypothetical protein